MQIRINGDSMWPTLRDGEVYPAQPVVDLAVGDIIVYAHPFQSGLKCVKRITSIESESIHVEGDNPDPTASDDSHNHGPIRRDSVIARLIIG